jgi:hypothetical protein
MLLTEMFDELGQAPGGKRPPGLLRRGPGDPADQLADVEAEPTGSAPAPFWVQRREPWVLNAWITSRAYCVVAANIAATSAVLRPWTEASTIPAPAAGLDRAPSW